MKKTTFSIMGKLPGLNEIINANRYNKYSGAKMKKDVTNYIRYFIREQKLKPIIKPIKKIKFIWIEKNKRRDKDNIRTGAKFILDALVAEKIIPNDGWKNIAGKLEDEFEVNKYQDGVIVSLYF